MSLLGLPCWAEPWPPRGDCAVWTALCLGRCIPQSRLHCWHCPGWRSRTGTAAWNPTPSLKTHSWNTCTPLYCQICRWERKEGQWGDKAGVTEKWKWQRENRKKKWATHDGELKCQLESPSMMILRLRFCFLDINVLHVCCHLVKTKHQINLSRSTAVTVWITICGQTAYNLTDLLLTKQYSILTFLAQYEGKLGKMFHSSNHVVMEIHVQYVVFIQNMNKHAVLHSFRMKGQNWRLQSNKHIWKCNSGFSPWPTNVHHFHQYTWVQMFQIFNSVYMQMTLSFSIVAIELSQACAYWNTFLCPLTI